MGLHLEPSEFQVAVKWWLGIPVAQGQSCSQCNAALDAYGHHALCCKLGGGGGGGDVISRHMQQVERHLQRFLSLCVSCSTTRDGWVV